MNQFFSWRAEIWEPFKMKLIRGLESWTLTATRLALQLDNWIWEITGWGLGLGKTSHRRCTGWVWEITGWRGRLRGNHPSQMKQLSLRNNRLRFKNSGKWVITLEEFMGYTSISWRKTCNLTGWTWKQYEFLLIMFNNIPSNFPKS